MTSAVFARVLCSDDCPVSTTSVLSFLRFVSISSEKMLEGSEAEFEEEELAAASFAAFCCAMYALRCFGSLRSAPRARSAGVWASEAEFEVLPQPLKTLTDHLERCCWEGRKGEEEVGAA